jgi:tRNA(fMet)-specific endonuclease VapC
MRYLLDTNILAEPNKPQPNQNVLDRLDQFAATIATSSVTWHELWFGTEQLGPSRRRQNLEAYLQNLITSQLPILPYTPEAARWFATERSRLFKLGLPPSYPDGQIAAIAAVNDLILVTRNISDFIHFDGLRLENWFD